MAIIIIRTLILYFAIVLTMRLMGKRQLGEMELPELVVAVLIADLGAHPLQDIGIPFMNGLLPVIILFCCEVLISGAAMKSTRLRTFVFGRPCFLVEKGVINQSEMHKNRFTIDELTEELRSNGVMDISQVEYAILETDGVLNAILFPEYRTATMGSLSLPTKDSGYPSIIINDGRIMGDNLKKAGRDRRWLDAELKRRKIKDPKQVYILTLDSAGCVYFALKEVPQ